MIIWWFCKGKCQVYFAPTFVYPQMYTCNFSLPYSKYAVSLLSFFLGLRTDSRTITLLIGWFQLAPFSVYHHTHSLSFHCLLCGIPPRLIKLHSSAVYNLKIKSCLILSFYQAICSPSTRTSSPCLFLDNI